ncbi:MAG TPA: amidohydrolase family protein [Dehalococcoidia bacterium]|nr:amidohydrolase family protein [Dehalococcoidia bacterium]
MADFQLISADSHLVEPEAAWERVQKEYGERAPRVVRDPPGVPKGTWLITEGLPPLGVSHFFIGLVIDKPEGVSSMETEKFGKVAGFNDAFRWEHYPEGWDPAARLRAQDRDGVEAEVLYASPARFFYGLTDASFQRAILRSYNAWLHDFCSYNPRRLIGVPLLTILDMDKTVDDIYELAKLGFSVAQIPTGIKDSGYYEPVYEPLWRAAAETGLVLSVHTTSTQGEQRRHFEGPRQVDPWTVALGHANLEAAAQRFMGHLVFSGVFDRYPSLKVVLAEFDVGWIAHTYQLANYAVDRSSSYDRDRNVQKLPPTDYLDRNLFFTFQDDRAGILTTEVFGRNNYLWASDFPHGVTTWPYSQATVDRNFDGIDGDVKRLICRENAIKLYRLNLD